MQKFDKRKNKIKYVEMNMCVNKVTKIPKKKLGVSLVVKMRERERIKY